jgi:hypothetical protein
MALSAQSGPSAAEALLRSGTANAANQNLALANSGRGLGGGAAARRAAMLSNAQLFGRMNADLAALRAQETQQDLARRAGAASAAGQVAGAGGQLALGTGGYVTGARGQAEGLATERGLGMIGQGVGAMGTGAQAVGTGGQTALSAQELVGRANEAQLNAQVAREQNATNRRGQDRGLQGQEAQAEAQRQAGLVGMFATGIGSIFGKPSDRAAKTDITPVFDSERSWVGGKPLQVRRSGDIFLSDAAEPERGTAGNSWVGGTQLKVRDPETGRLVNATDSPSSGGGGRVPSEAETAVARAREDSLARATGRGRSMAQQFAEEMNMPHELGHVSPSPREAMRTIDNAPAYSFLYKDPERHGEGRRVGVMAQDLEKTPAGRQAVFRSPDGMRAVDTGELSTINTAALFGVQQRQDDLESGQSALADEIRRMRRMFEFEPPEVDRDALDAAAQRERSFGL